ncbi:MAG: DEAD/DEAH box helicase [Gemmatimonadetes bacterium]|nr:DEAD/DEAH box helicase [Gemmatimonadota bacterium]
MITEAIDTPPDDEESRSESWEVQNRRKLDSAARITLSVADGLAGDPGTASSLRTLSAIAFGLDGNHVSARITGLRVLDSPGVDPTDILALGVGCPLLASECASRLSDDSLATEALVAATACLGGDDAAADRIKVLANEFYVQRRRPGLALMMGCALRGFEVSVNLRFDRVLNEAAFTLKSSVLANLVASGRPLALPAQRDALQIAGFLENARGSLVSLPTGAGKTLVGLLSLASQLQSSTDIGVFLAPYHSIRRQVVAAAARLFGSSVEVVTGVDAGRLQRRARVLVDTPEGFDYRVRRSAALRDRIRGVVFDEAHLLGDSSRGLLTDGVLTRLRMSRLPGERPKITLLSAVLDSQESLVAWLSEGGSPATEAESRWRPAARRVGIWVQDGTLEWIRIEGSVSGSRGIRTIAKEQVSPAATRLPAAGKYRPGNERMSLCDDNVSRLAVALFARRPENTLVVVGTRTRARSVARRISGALERVPAGNVPARTALATLVRERYPVFSDLVALVERGVAYHTAVLPVALRGEIERACEKGAIQFVCATTSLAEGADLPFGRCILADWMRIGDGGERRTYKPALWKNIAGRCGRPGTHIEGETIVVEVTPPDDFATNLRRRNALGRMLGGFVTVESALRSNGDNVALTSEQLVGQALAAVAENPNLDDSHLALVDGLLATRIGGAVVAQRARSTVETRLLGGQAPLVTRNSPLQLTPLGKAIVGSAVLPRTAELIVESLEKEPSATSIETLCLQILIASSGSVELVSSRLPDVVRGQSVQNLWVRPGEFPEVVSLWFAGGSVGEILVALSAKKGRANALGRAQLMGWLSTGDDVDDGAWARRYEKLQDFLHDVFVQFLPRALTAVESVVREGVVQPLWTFELQSAVDFVGTRAREWREYSEPWESAQRA